MTPGVRVHFVFPPELLERLDAALGLGQSRGDWVRRAVEQALGGLDQSALSRLRIEDRDLVPAPAEQSPYDDHEAHVAAHGPDPTPEWVKVQIRGHRERLRKEHLPSCKCPVCS